MNNIVSIPALDAKLNSNPDDVLALRERAFKRYQVGDREGALADIEHAKRLIPNDTECLNVGNR